MYASIGVNLDKNYMQVSDNHIQPYMFHDIYFICKLDLKLGYDMCGLDASLHHSLCCINHTCKYTYVGV